MTRILLISLFLLPACFIQAQSLYTPRNIQKAYDKGTRSLDGKPGKNYWQNQGKYDIHVAFEESTQTVQGTETIVYTNNSPDTLASIALRFVNNLHKPESPRLRKAAKDYLTTGLQIHSFKMNGTAYNVDASDWGTVEDVPLQQAILPGQTVTFDIAWSYPISKKGGREGQIDAHTFFMAYAYPRISVYDDYNGWDKIPHTGIEFYNDFNDYQLAVKVPKNYVVWATGDLQNVDEVLQPQIAARYKQSLTADDVIHVATATEMQERKVTQQNEWNTWKFTAKNITDVTFSISKDYVWDASSVVVDAKTGRRVSMQAAYADGSEDFTHVVKWGKMALKWYSENWPGIPYPYSKMTAFQGFGDMEYPMMVNDAVRKQHIDAQYLLNHEIAHTWFPFYMGTNETRYAFMDEGWVVAFEYLIGTEQYGAEKAIERQRDRRVSSWALDHSTESDQPIITMSPELSTLAYRTNSYGKPSLAYLALKDLLGDDLFKKALHIYMDRWNGKHPTPWDFFYSFNDAAKQDLNWFWDNWFFKNHYMDLSIAAVTNQGKVTVDNVGGFAIPFDVEVTYTDGRKERIHQTPSVWKSNPKQVTISMPNDASIASVSIDTQIFVDATPENNYYSKSR